MKWKAGTILAVGLSLTLVAACGDDDSGNNNINNNNNANTNCVDSDGDGHDAVDAVNCPTGDDQCDDDAFNWTSTGCADCVDNDGDGYGTDCDQGTDCDDTDDTIHSGCAGCVDNDNDDHDAYDAVDCPTGDDQCDNDEYNWTTTGCADCVDNDGDGYGTDCDLGADCDDNDDTIHTGCTSCADGDNDGHDGYDATTCPSGDDHCDNDEYNWTTTGCTSCVDNDGDGYGTDCDLGPDCNDNVGTIHTGCTTNCVDSDHDGHDAYDATDCPAGDDQCDGDEYNWTTNGCTNCVDNDNDGYGTDCDLGPDCDDGNGALHVNCQVAYYWGDFVTNNTYEAAMVTFPGSNVSVLPVNGTVNISSVAVSADGSRVAVAGEDANGDQVLNVYVADGTGNATTLVTYSETWTADIDQVAFSPDGAWIAYRADADLDGGDAVYVVPTDGSAAPKRVTQVPPSSGNDVTNFVWSMDTSGTARYLAFRGDMVTASTYGLWVVDVTASSPSPQLIESADVGSALAFDAQGRLYYTYNSGTEYQLWRSEVTGTNKEQVPGTILSNGGGEASIGSLGMSPSGTKLAFAADAPTADLYEVYVLDLSTTTADLVSDVSALTPASGSSGPTFYELIQWSPDETLLGVVADWQLSGADADNDYAAFVLPATTPAGGVRLMNVATASSNMDVVSVRFSADSQRLFVMGDLRVNNDTEIYSTDDLTTADQDTTTALVQSVPSGGDVSGLTVQ